MFIINALWNTKSDYQTVSYNESSMLRGGAYTGGQSLMIIDGFPTLLNKKAGQAADLNRVYIERLAEGYMSRISDVKRNPVKARSLLRSLARNTATLVDISALEKDIQPTHNQDISRPTIYDYLDALNRLKQE